MYLYMLHTCTHIAVCMHICVYQYCVFGDLTFSKYMHTYIATFILVRISTCTHIYTVEPLDFKYLAA